MATRLNNMAALFKDGRTRTIILITVFILLAAVIIGIFSMRSKKGITASAGVSATPGNIQSVPFNAPNDEYARLQEQQNKQLAKKAEKVGGSAIPTIIDSKKGDVVSPETDAQAGIGFTALSREQSDAGTFEAKPFGSEKSQVCPPAEALNKGAPIYDENGHLIGYADSEGRVRDINGKIIGTVGHDGKVRDISGKILGSLGDPVYDQNGKLLGYMGPDGKLRDASGKIIGTRAPDGSVQDLQGNIIAKVGAAVPGSPIYDTNGNILGYLGPDGKLRDSKGQIRGNFNESGPVLNNNGQVMADIGENRLDNRLNNNIAAQNAADISTAPDMSGVIAQKQLLIAQDQKLSQLMQQKQQAMNTQASQLLTAWTSPIQQYVTGQQDTNNDTGDGNQSDQTNSKLTINNKNTQTNSGPVFIKAGTVYYAVINTAINSDEPGPVMATIINGDYKGGKLLGTLVNQGKAVLITFNILTLPQLSKSISINSVAIDQNTARTALSTETNNHYLLRYGSLFAAAFTQGYAQAITTSGSTQSTNGLSTQTSTQSLSPVQELAVALGNVGTQFGTQLNSVYTTPPTVYVASGTAVGILFMGDVSLPTS